ncbi:MAG TPA: Fic family protein [Polyangiaceae bacterium]|nr:Fic family protein [Polyangiaceae bacterium]
MSARKKHKTPRQVSRPKRRAGKPVSRPASQRSSRPAKAAKASRARSGRAAKPARKASAKAGARKPDAAALRKQKERDRLLKEKAQLQKQKEKEKELQSKLKEKERLAKEKEKERQAKEKQRELLQKEKEKERLAKEKEKERQAKEKQRELLQKEKEKERLAKQKEKERVLKEKERAAQKEAAQKAREAERERIRLEKEAERERIRQEKEAEREELRRQKEAERARRDAEREAYRKAKEAERERLRAEREAARRALEGKVARANKRAQRADGVLGRGTATTRVYRPDAIPDQSGTTRRAGEAARLVGIRPVVAAPSALAAALGTAQVAPSVPAPNAEARPTPPPPPSLSVEERWARISQRLEATETSFQREYRESFDMSWIYHDSALEGVVYTFQELKTAVDPAVTVVPDSSLQPVCEEIRRNRQAIELVRELAEKRRVPLNVDIIKKLYVTLHPEEGDVKTVKYRKDIPQHRLYFHEYAPPDKIAYKVRQVVDWLNGPEPKKMKNPLRVAARVHYDLLRAFPFQTDSGKAARLLMNVILMRAGYPPAIIHSTERQKYYEALKGQLPIIIGMVNDAITNALLSIEKRLEEYEARGRS